MQRFNLWYHTWNVSWPHCPRTISRRSANFGGQSVKFEFFDANVAEHVAPSLSRGSPMISCCPSKHGALKCDAVESYLTL